MASIILYNTFRYHSMLPEFSHKYKITYLAKKTIQQKNQQQNPLHNPHPPNKKNAKTCKSSVWFLSYRSNPPTTISNPTGAQHHQAQLSRHLKMARFELMVIGGLGPGGLGFQGGPLSNNPIHKGDPIGIQTTGPQTTN